MCDHGADAIVHLRGGDSRIPQRRAGTICSCPWPGALEEALSFRVLSGRVGPLGIRTGFPERGLPAQEKAKSSFLLFHMLHRESRVSPEELGELLLINVDA